MSNLRPIALPFHNGLPDVGMGLGVRALIDELGLAADVVAAVDASQPEVRRTIELDRRLGERVRAAVSAGAFPLVLAGNCNSCLGTVGGVGSAGLGVVWFDAHADFDTPEDNVSGFFDVMALSTLTGSAWQAQRAKVCAEPVSEEDFRGWTEAILEEGRKTMSLLQRRRNSLPEEVRAGVPYPAILVELRERAKAEGLWNLFLPDERYGPGLTHWEYGMLCEEMGRSPVAPLAFNCSAPDTGNAEILAEYATDEQRERWLHPLLEGAARSAAASR